MNTSSSLMAVIIATELISIATAQSVPTIPPLGLGASNPSEVRADAPG